LQGPYVAARVEFEPATFRTQGTELNTEAPRPNEVRNGPGSWSAYIEVPWNQEI